MQGSGVKMDVTEFLAENKLIHRVESALSSTGHGSGLLADVGGLPIRKSRAVRRMGAYVTRDESPVEIRLQFALPENELVETFLHELAHCFDHLTNQPGKRYRRAHGPGWKLWARALGIDPVRCGESRTLNHLYKRRLRIVAVCRKCGFELRRVRRLPRNRKYLHPECGGKFRPLP